MSQSSNRMPLIDAFKAIASQLIVFHHLSAYGPLSLAAQEAAPGTMGWLFDYARIAVQVFLVIGGFLAARGLSAEGQGLTTSPLPLIWKRYLRLAIPFMTAIVLAIIGAALASLWLDDEAIPARATLSQWLAHALLLHGVLGVDSLSAGVWYVAIDFQLFALMALLLWLGRFRFLAPALVLGMATASLYCFNRDADLDNWSLYFFGSYGLGAAVWWASDRRHLSSWLGVVATVVIAALVVDFRLRIAVALGVAMVIGFSRRTGWLENFPTARPIDFLGRISYSVFLVHFPICLLVNAAYAHFDLSSPVSALLGMAAAWAASIAAGTLFHRWIEGPEASRRITAALDHACASVLAAGRRVPGSFVALLALLALFVQRA